MRALCVLLLPIIAACSGSGSSPIGGGPTPIVTDGGGLSFDTTKAFLTRGQWCGSPPPLAPSDAYSLVLRAVGEAPAQTVTISVLGKSPIGVARALTVLPWKAGDALEPGDNDVNPEEATSESGDESFSLLRGLTPSAPDPNPFDEATLTVVSLPQKEGDAFSVRIELHFTDGKALGQTFTSVLDEQPTACAGTE